jgi:hypothetical protein
MRLTRLEFGSLLSYCPRGGDSAEIQHSRQVMSFIKNDSFVEDPPDPSVLMSNWIARTMERGRSQLPFSSFFRTSSILVPLPRSSLLQPDSLWVPERIATALVRRGFGVRVLPCLTRTRVVRKSATSQAGERPTPTEHFESLAVQGNLGPTEDIVLVDDIVTRGHTMIGAANRLVEAFPSSRIQAFAAMRTVSDWTDFSHIYEPRVGLIEYRENSDDCIRRP